MNKTEALNAWREVLQRAGGKQRWEREVLPHLDEVTQTAYEYVRWELS